MKIMMGVGLNQPNNLNDVKLVQSLLNKHIRFLAPIRSLSEDGRCGVHTARAIKEFQLRVVKLHHPDGIVAPNGATFLVLMRDGVGSPAAAGAKLFSDEDYLARTIYGEARGQSIEWKLP